MDPVTFKAVTDNGLAVVLLVAGGIGGWKLLIRFLDAQEKAAAERIAETIADRNYWRDIALSSLKSIDALTDAVNNLRRPR